MLIFDGIYLDNPRLSKTAVGQPGGFCSMTYTGCDNICMFYVVEFLR